MVAAGETFGYTVTVANQGPSTAANVTVVDQLPADVIFVAGQSDARCQLTPSGTAVLCSLGAHAPGPPVALRIVVRTDPTAAPGDLVNEVSVAGGTPDPTPGPTTASVTTRLERQADLQLTKTVATATPVAGQDLTYDLTVTNAGPSTADTVAVVDAVPAELAVVSVASTPPGACTTADETITCTFATLGVGDQATVTIVTRLPADLPPTSVTNAASVSSSTPDPDPASDTATATVATVALADLSVTKRTVTDPVIAGAPATWEVTVTNAGPSVAAGARIVDVLAAGLTLVAGSSGCEAQDQEQATVVSCALGDLAVGANARVTITVAVPAGATGTLVNTAIAGSDYFDSKGDDNEATAVATITPPPIVGSAQFVPLLPARILDTRTENPQVGYFGPKPAPGAVIELQVTGRGGVPHDGVAAVVFNLTAKEATGPASSRRGRRASPARPRRR